MPLLPFKALRPSYDGPPSWLMLVGWARMGVLAFVASGAYLIASPFQFSYFLASLYIAAFASSLWYLIVLRREKSVSAVLTWTQMLVDFGVVALTISYTRGQGSFFTFLLVIVILEAGVLMGLMQGFVFATLASSFMMFLFLLSSRQAADPLTHWYNFLIQGIAFFFTAFISGYWNQRVSRMKQFQREILDNMNSGFLITDTKGIVIAINQSACQILDLVESNVAGRHVEGVLRPEADAECPIITALRHEKDFASYEFYVHTEAHQTKLLGLTTNRIHDSRDHITGLIASFTDLTEMAQMRQELQRQDRMATIGELSAGLAHEIRNPVASIRGAVEELQHSIEEADLARRLAAIALRESDHLNEIVESFLSYARNPEKLEQSFSITEVLADACAQLRHKYQDQPDLEIACAIPEGSCAVVGDATQIRQVFINLGQNAIEAMAMQGRLEICLVAGASSVEIRFDDEGPGIDPDKVARIFEPFYTEKERGVGMGLAICMRIITTHDGAIQVASRSGGGASMRVRLPLARTAS